MKTSFAVIAVITLLFERILKTNYTNYGNYSTLRYKPSTHINKFMLSTVIYCNCCNCCNSIFGGLNVRI